jgi:hypothetical protein
MPVKYELDARMPCVEIEINDSYIALTKQGNGDVLISINGEKGALTSKQYQELFTMLDVLRSARRDND